MAGVMVREIKGAGDAADINIVLGCRGGN